MNEKITAKKIIEQEIIKKIEENNLLPWQSPWFAIGKRNLVSGHVYRGINKLLLAYEEDTCFLTFKQANELGLKIKKGSHGRIVSYWMIYAKNGAKVDGEEEIAKKILIPKYYRVFRLSDCEEWEKNEKAVALYNKEKELFTHEKNIELEAIVSKTGAVITHTDKTQAFCSGNGEYINMPEIGQFADKNEYYRVLFHELTHWTGTAERLNRKSFAEYTNKAEHSREELTAEIGSVLLSTHTGIGTSNTAPSYIQGWAQWLKDKISEIWSAASKAEEASEYILSF